MGYIILLVIVIFLMRKLIQAMGDVTWSLKTYKPAKLSWKQSGLFAGAIGVIVLAEIALPSLRITGLERVAKRPPPDHLSSMEFTDAPLTYAEMGRAAPFLWRLGEITRAEMQDRLDADIVLAEAERDEANSDTQFFNADGTPRDAYRLLIPLSVRARSHLSEAMVDGLKQARSDLDTLFTDGPIPVWTADRFVLERVTAVLDAKEQAAEDAYDAASKEQSEVLEGLSAEERREHPEYSRLSRQVTETLSRLTPFHTARITLQQHDMTLPKEDTALPLGTPFPPYPHPLLVTSETTALKFSVTDAITAPPPETGARFYAAMSDALTGRLRHRTQGEVLMDCALTLRNGKAEPFCLVTKPLAVNYDVTGAGCAIPYADGLCVERWIFPHLSIRFAPGNITLYPPSPIGSDAPSRLSQWSVEWQGQTHRLDAPLTLPWSGAEDDLNELRLIHAPRADLVQPGIWQEFRPHYPGDDLTARAAAPPHVFDAQTIIGFQHPFGNFRGFLDIANPARQGMFAPPASFTTRQERLDMLSTKHARQIPAHDPARALCSSRAIIRDAFEYLELDLQLGDFIDATQGETCAAFHGYQTILTAIERAQHGGSWLWLAHDGPLRL